MIIVAVRIGNKYSVKYETYLEQKLPKAKFIWIREPIQPHIMFQWNKMYGMSLDLPDPICVIDIDILLINDYLELFNYPIKPNEFIAMPSWWGDTSNPKYKINGGFFKYYPKDCKYIYDKFMKDPLYWQKYYIKNGTTTGPVNGEQYFVEDSVLERLNLKLLPNEWVCRMVNEDFFDNKDMYDRWLISNNIKYNKITNNSYMYLDKEYHQDIKLVHYAHSLNKPR